MAKNMAYVQDGIVTNILWCSDKQTDTDTLISVGDIPVAIDDTYSDGAFYRDGEKVLTPLEEAQKTIAEYAEALKIVGVTV